MSLHTHIRRLSFPLTLVTLVILVVLTIGTIASSGRTEPVDYTDHALVRVEILSRGDLDLLMKFSPDIWSEHVYAGLPVLARIPPGSMVGLEKSGLDFHIVDEDLGPDLSRYYPANRNARTHVLRDAPNGMS